MTRKVKINKDNSVTVTMSGRDNAEFWVAVDREKNEWFNKGYRLVFVEKGGNTFQDGILTSLLNFIRQIIGRSVIHDPVVIMTFAK